MNSVLSLSDEQAVHGVVTHSSGNHAAALACAARIRGIPAYIVIPSDAPQASIYPPLRSSAVSLVHVKKH